MKILTIDTSTPVEVVSVVDGDRLMGVSERRTDRGHAERLMEAVHAVLHEAGVATQDLDGIAVAVGPGRFSGLRVGLATAKGLAVSTGLPIWPVSTTEALAASAPAHEGLILSAIDARKGEVYCALFDASGQRCERLSEDAALEPQEAARMALAAADGRTVQPVGSGASEYADELRAILGDGPSVPECSIDVSDPVVLAALAIRAAGEGEAPELDGLEPVYLRGI
ncbi:tRNA (adenosine(37)-N6)-threonylcarbamoyltransferase complex dimerization subunit type 1 TsaB [bacterium]|nr:tRNA (adenosine(37)-N6)-threonylcarbamoyltransferase complex dimerization subunit type 1 TsaB [bacterium]